MLRAVIFQVFFQPQVPGGQMGWERSSRPTPPVTAPLVWPIRSAEPCRHRFHQRAKEDARPGAHRPPALISPTRFPPHGIFNQWDDQIHVLCMIRYLCVFCVFALCVWGGDREPEIEEEEKEGPRLRKACWTHLWYPSHDPRVYFWSSFTCILTFRLVKQSCIDRR